MSNEFRDGQKWPHHDDVLDTKINELVGVEITVAIDGVVRKLWIRSDGEGGIEIGHEPTHKVTSYKFNYDGMD